MIVARMNPRRPFPEDYERVVCFDIDGTLADTDYRQHFLQQEPPNWKEFLASAINDKMNPQMAYMNDMLGRDSDNVIILTTGREFTQSGDVTFKWLEKMPVTWHQILFRAAGDYRHDYEVKDEMISFIENNWWMKPFMVFDDRKSVVEKCWIKNKIYCLDVGNGKGDF